MLFKGNSKSYFPKPDKQLYKTKKQDRRKNYAIQKVVLKYDFSNCNHQLNSFHKLFNMVYFTHKKYQIYTK